MTRAVSSGVTRSLSGGTVPPVTQRGHTPYPTTGRNQTILRSPKHFIAALALTLTLAACTPTQAASWLNANGRGPVAPTSAEARQASRLFTAYWRIMIYTALVEAQQRDLVWKWQKVADCESGDRPHINTGNGFQGWLQWLPSTWAAYGGRGSPQAATPLPGSGRSGTGGSSPRAHW